MSYTRYFLLFSSDMVQLLSCHGDMEPSAIFNTLPHAVVSIIAFTSALTVNILSHLRQGLNRRRPHHQNKCCFSRHTHLPYKIFNNPISSVSHMQGCTKWGTRRTSPPKAEANDPINCRISTMYFQLKISRPIVHTFGLFMVNLCTEWYKLQI